MDCKIGWKYFINHEVRRTLSKLSENVVNLKNVKNLLAKFYFRLQNGIDFFLNWVGR